MFGKYLPFFESISFYLEGAVPLPFGTLFLAVHGKNNTFSSVYCCERYIQSWNSDPLENRRNLPTLIGRLEPLSCFYQPISANLFILANQLKPISCLYQPISANLSPDYISQSAQTSLLFILANQRKPFSCLYQPISANLSLVYISQSAQTFLLFILANQRKPLSCLYQPIS